MSVPPFLRKVIHRLPGPIRQALHRSHSLRVVRDFQPADWEYHVLAADSLRGGDCAVDAGAIIGCVTKLLAGLVGPQGRVHSFEPIRETAAILAHFAGAQGLSQVVVHPAGVSDQSGAARIVVPAHAQGGKTFSESAITRGDTPGEEVRLVTLDGALAGETRPVRFIKIDVGGNGLAAVRGALRVLAHHRPVLLVEIQGDPSAPTGPARELFDLLSRCAYSPHLLREGKPTPWQPGEVSADYIFLPLPGTPGPPP